MSKCLIHIIFIPKNNYTLIFTSVTGFMGKLDLVQHPASLNEEVHCACSTFSSNSAFLCSLFNITYRKVLFLSFIPFFEAPLSLLSVLTQILCPILALVTEHHCHIYSKGIVMTSIKHIMILLLKKFGTPLKSHPTSVKYQTFIGSKEEPSSAHIASQQSYC